MNKKIMLLTALLFASNASFCMENDNATPAQAPTDSRPQAWDNIGYYQEATAEQRTGEETQAYSVPSAPPLSPKLSELAAASSEPTPGNSNANPRKRPTIFSIAQSLAYDKAPAPIKKMCDQAEEHPNVAVLTALTAGECCGTFCCPNLTRAFNLLALGWGARVMYSEFMTKEKEF